MARGSARVLVGVEDGVVKRIINPAVSGEQARLFNAAVMSDIYGPTHLATYQMPSLGEIAARMGEPVWIEVEDEHGT
jgi:hypothetical protein